jgi:hypothetical protein
MVGRYVKCLKGGTWCRYLKKGDYLKIEKIDDTCFYFDYELDRGAFDKSRLTDSEKAFELMPENWTPYSENNILNTLELW